MRHSGIICALLLVLAAPAALAQPRLVCEHPVHDFGRVPNHQAIRHTFVLRNEGDQPLVIDRLRVCCGAMADITTMRLEAGEEAELNVRLSLLGRTGKQRKSIYVVSNDPDDPFFKLQLVGFATTEIDINPERLDFGDIEENDHKSVAATLTATESLVFHVTNAVSSLESFTVHVEPLTNGRGYRVVAHSRPPLPGGYLRGRVTVHTDHPRYPRIELPLTVRVGSDLVVVPRKIEIRPQPSGEEGITRYVAVRSRSGRTFRIIDVEVPGDGIEVDHAPLGKHGYRLTLRGLGSDRALDGRFLTIHTDLEDMPEITIPFEVTQ